MKKVSMVVAGAGSRGTSYTNYVKHYPEEGEVLAVCEPRDWCRNSLGDNHGIPENKRFRDWKDLLDQPKLADCALICTQDAMHREPAVALAKKGYHLLLEKPMAPSEEDCRAIYQAAKENGVMLAVCHVLRYTDVYRKLKETIDSGIIGRIHNIQHMEPVGYWHQAHSFVRGNWRNEEESSFMLLAKSCHDMDLLNYLTPARCTKVSSFGSLSYFKKANQPKGAADRCTDCPEAVESKCPYSALKIYYRKPEESYGHWPTHIITPEATAEAVLRALKEGPYGRCVFACDNDVVDHQVVNLEFADGATASFTMSAFNYHHGRETFVMGDLGTLRCTEQGIEHCDFLTEERKNIPLTMGDNMITSGHGGGDFGLMRSFLAAVRDNDPSHITSGPDVSLESHLIVFAAERARLGGTVETVKPA